MIWHHLAYRVISVAMLGFGAAGSLRVVLGKRLGGSSPARALAWLAAGCGIAVLAALGLATQLTVDTVSIWQDKSNLTRLAALYRGALPFAASYFRDGSHASPARHRPLAPADQPRDGPDCRRIR